MTVNFVRANAAKVSQAVIYDVIGVTHGLREVIFEADTPGTSVEVEYNVINPGGGSGDIAYLRLGDYVAGAWDGGAYIMTPTQSGIIVVSSPSPQVKLWCQLGYTNDVPAGLTLYDINECMFRIIQFCE